MSDHPIIFSAPMVRALLDGRKTMTRRLAWRSETDTKKMAFVCDGEMPPEISRKAKGLGVQMAGCYWLRPTPWPRVRIGNRLWVRETWTPHASGVDLAADIHEASLAQAGPWRSSMFMPRKVSRLTLIVTATKIERLQDISEPDAKAEGAILHDGHGVGHTGYRHDPSDGVIWATCKESFARLWQNLHGGAAWHQNPEVVALTFTVHKQNIDAMPKAEAA